MTIKLTKKGMVNLSKMSTTLSELTIGLGWDPIARKTGLFRVRAMDNIDLDASCVVMDDAGSVIDTVWFNHSQQVSTCGAIKHSGDNLTGEGEGDDEQISINLNLLNKQAKYLAFTINSYRNHTFNDIENAFCRVVDQSGKELVRYDLSEKGRHTGLLIAVMIKKGSDWHFQACGETAIGKTVLDMYPTVINAVKTIGL